MYKIIFFAVLILSSPLVYSQSIPNEGNEMSWVGIGVDKKFSDKFSMSFFQTNSFELNNKFKPNFIQPGIKFYYHVKDFKFYIGTKPAFSIDAIADNQLIYHRLTSGAEYEFRFNKYFRGDVSLNFEHHFTERSKFQQRYYLRLDLFYRNTKLPLRLRPFFDQRLYWYSGGRPLQYYDDLGNKTDLLPTNGLHAYRYRLGLKLYPKKQVILAVYFEQQKEFNTTLFGSNPINNLNPNSGSIRRPFYDNSVIGVFFILNL